MQINFPSSFLWGAATSSYQCEGGNFNSDWCAWEKEKSLVQAKSACNHYNLFEKDFKLASALNFNALRISIEWARLFPDADIFNNEQLAHYSKVIESLLKYNLKPVVTLHHFTNPIWFAKKGGWANHKNIDYFLKYLQKTVLALKDNVDLWIIFNEPLVYIYNGFIQGLWPPGVNSLAQAHKALDNIIKAHCIGYEEIKRIYQGTTAPKVSMAKSMRIFSGCSKFSFGLNHLSAYFRNRLFNFWTLERLIKKEAIDFIAINYYCREYDKFKGFLGQECSHKHKGRKNYMGWDIHPQGFYKILCKLKKFKLPVIVTENGTAENEDRFYQEYLSEHLKSLALAFKDGVNIGGYLWWSLLDNFEWDKGFGPRFGLIKVDYSSMERSIKPFAYIYAKICKENKITV